MIKSASHRLATLGFVALALVALGADEATQTIEADGLSFKVPASWKKARSTSTMRKAQLNVEPSKGDKDPAVLVVFKFPGGAGTVQANVDRWQKQFTDKDGKTPEVETKKVKGQNTDVTRVEVAGTYTDPIARTGPQSTYRLLGAIVETKDAGFFLKMTGPDKTMKDAATGFDELLKSIKVQE